MAEEALRKMDLSQPEIERFSKAMKDPQFMKLLSEYAQEISQPLDREEAENYIKMVEERAKGGFSMEGKELIIPTPAFCFKVKNKKTHSKFFINICHSDKLDPPTSTQRADGSGADWHIPYGMSQIHKDKDKNGVDCESVDYVVNEDACKRCVENTRFKQFLAETAIESIEKSYKMQLNREIVYPRLKYKGASKTPKMMTIPSSKTSKNVKNEDQKTESKKDKKGINQKTKDEEKQAPQTEVQEPKYEVIYRSGLDIGKFWMDNNIGIEGNNQKPKEIMLRVFLPGITSASEVDLDVSDTQALLMVRDRYKLEVKWRYEVDSNKGCAKFDKTSHKLEVVLPTKNNVTNAN